jgi:hypothetical protein
MPLFPLGTLAAGIVGGFTGAAAEQGMMPLTQEFTDAHRYIILFVLLGIVGFWLLTKTHKRRR